MTDGALYQAKLARVRRELPRIEAAGEELLSHLRLLSDISSSYKNVPRTLREEHDALQASAATLVAHLERVGNEAFEVVRHRPRRPPRSAGVGRFEPFVDTGSLRALCRRLEPLPERLDEALRAFDGRVRALEDEPGRYGDAAADTAVAAVVQQVHNAIELLRRFVFRMRD